MEIKFPNIPLYQGWGAPLRVESDLRDLELIHGQVPEDLNGTLYRCGPDRQYPPMHGDDIFIDGEGMTHMFRFTNGHVDYRSRWVRSERFLLQEQARRSLFGRYRNRYTNDPSVAGRNQGTANTNAIWHGRKLLILKEDSLPVEVHPDTLETIGPWDYQGAVKAVSLSAHPKVDLHRNELLTYSYQATGDGSTDIVFYIMDAEGKVTQELWFNMPYPGMVHDFAVTDTHVIFPFWPVITDMTVVRNGGPYYQWHPDKECHFAIFPRRGKAEDIRWFRGPAASAGHMMNAFNEGARLHLDVCLYQGNCFEFFPSYDGSPYRPCPPQLTRLSFDLDQNRTDYASRILLPTPSEMPRIDERYIGKTYRYGYMLCRSPDAAAAGTIGLSAIGCIDHETGALTTWSPGPDSGVQEPIFVPRQIGAAEGDGYLLVLVNRMPENRSDLAVLDARSIADGPVALLKLSLRVRSTFHGMWVPGQALQTGIYNV